METGNGETKPLDLSGLKNLPLSVRLPLLAKWYAREYGKPIIAVSAGVLGLGLVASVLKR